MSSLKRASTITLFPLPQLILKMYLQMTFSLLTLDFHRCLRLTSTLAFSRQSLMSIHRFLANQQSKQSFQTIKDLARKYFLNQTLTLVSPQSPPIAIHHNVPAPAIRYGYWSPDHLDDHLVHHLDDLDHHLIKHLINWIRHQPSLVTLPGTRCWTWASKRHNDQT